MIGFHAGGLGAAAPNNDHTLPLLLTGLASVAAAAITTALRRCCKGLTPLSCTCRGLETACREADGVRDCCCRTWADMFALSTCPAITDKLCSLWNIEGIRCLCGVQRADRCWGRTATFRVTGKTPVNLQMVVFLCDGVQIGFETRHDSLLERLLAQTPASLAHSAGWTPASPGSGVPASTVPINRPQLCCKHLGSLSNWRHQLNPAGQHTPPWPAIHNGQACVPQAASGRTRCARQTPCEPSRHWAQQQLLPASTTAAAL